MSFMTFFDLLVLLMWAWALGMVALVAGVVAGLLYLYDWLLTLSVERSKLSS